ncbi:MAG TPA: TIM barrel protein [Thermoguttaceae bacterium]|nr:TIM barrel protein [Thermoguttaceae bacterium]
MFRNLDTSVLGIGGPQSEVIEQSLTYGFQAMDFDVVEFAARAKLRGMAHARRLIDSSRVRIGTFGLPFRPEEDQATFNENLARLEDWAAAAAEVGCGRCVTWVEPAGDRLPYHENFTFHCDRFAAICGVLRPHDARLGVGIRAAADLRRGKAFQFIHDFEALSMLTKMVNAANIGLAIDVWDLFVSGGSLETLRGLSADQLVAVRLADAPPDVPLEDLTESSRRLPSVEGRFDVPGALAALAEMGYKGPVSVSPHRTAMGSNGGPVIKTLGQSLDAVWNAAGLNVKGRLPVTAQGAKR